MQDSLLGFFLETTVAVSIDSRLRVIIDIYWENVIYLNLNEGRSFWSLILFSLMEHNTCMLRWQQVIYDDQILILAEHDKFYIRHFQYLS